MQIVYGRFCRTFAAALVAVGIGALSAVSAEVPLVLRFAGSETGADKILAEFAALPPGEIARARTDDFAARNLALNWYHRILFARAAQDDGLLLRKPGLAQAAAAQSRRLVAGAYIDDLAKTRFAPTEQELQQLHDLEPGLCIANPRIRLARLGVSLARHAGEAERVAAKIRMDSLLQRLAAGAAFATVADEASDFVESGGGGDMGWLSHKSVRAAPGGESLIRVPVGGRSEVLETGMGWVLFEVIAREEEGRLDFAQCRSRLKAAITEHYLRDLRRGSIERLAARYDAFLDIDAFVAAVRAVPAVDDPRVQRR
ncbi:MAG: peptidylprolyl isomerase [Deltaproteobacteria bacterium]